MSEVINDTIVFGIGDNNEWVILKKSGKPELKDIPLIDLIPDNFNIIGSQIKSIIRILGDGTGKYGISLTTKINSNPITYGAVIFKNTFEQVLINPTLLVRLLKNTFNIDEHILKETLGFQIYSYSRIDYLSSVIASSINIILLRKSNCLIIPIGKEIKGLLTYLSSFWGLILKNLKLKISITHPLQFKKNQFCTLVSLNTLAILSDSIFSAYRVKIKKSNNTILIRLYNILDIYRFLFCKRT